MSAVDAFVARLTAAWPDALAAWSAHTLLRAPRVLTTREEAAAAGLPEQIASIRLTDSTIFVHAARCIELGLEGCELALLAHEVGHHIYVPGNLSEHARMFAYLQPRLAGLPAALVPLVANLWADTLINDRLQRQAGVDIAEVYRRLFRARSGAPDLTWRLYMRTYELLWRLDPGALVEPHLVSRDLAGDALLCSRIARACADEPALGAGRYASVLYRWLSEDQQAGGASTFAAGGLFDTRDAALDEAGEPVATLPAGVLHRPRPDTGPLVPGLDGPADEGDTAMGPGDDAERTLRTPAEVGALLRAMGLAVDEGALVARYYRELAAPHLIQFPKRRSPRAPEPLLEGVDPWDAGDDVSALDLLESVVRSPRLVPGVTTVQRHFGTTAGGTSARQPVDLDLYIDCSGSMPDPRRQISYLTLAGAILALSALRSGSRVQVTLWSTSAVSTEGFVRDPAVVLQHVCGYVSGGTRFPLDVLHDTYARRPAHERRPAHVVVISDDGIDTLLRGQHEDRAGAEVAREALERAGGGGTLVLNIGRPLPQWQHTAALRGVGFAVHRVAAWPELVTFARAFAQDHYGAA